MAQTASDFTGLALLSSEPTTVVLKAIDATGLPVTGGGIRNPAIVPLSAGQQFARLVSEIFAMPNFDGWIELESSSKNLGVYAATGTTDLAQMDGIVARNPSTDFVLFRPGAEAVLVNPSVRQANVSVQEFGSVVHSRDNSATWPHYYSDSPFHTYSLIGTSGCRRTIHGR